MNTTTNSSEWVTNVTAPNITHPSVDAYSNWVTHVAGPNTTHPSVDVYYDNWGYKLRTYSLVLCTALGLLGNLLAFLVFTKSKIKTTSTGVYLMTLAWADSAYLVMETLIRWNTLAVDHRTCRVAWVLKNIFKLQEAFLIVAICADRMFHFLAPYTCAKCSGAKCAAFVVALLTGVSAVLSGYLFRCAILYGKACNLDSYDPGHICKLTWFTVSVIVGELLTSVLVIVMAVYIVRALRYLRQRARRLSRNQQSVSMVDREVTRMTIAVAIVFSCFRLPYSIVYITFYVRHMFYLVPYLEKIQVGLVAAIEVLSVPHTMNYCVNFVIYIVFWKSFRRKFFEILGRKPVNDVRLYPLKDASASKASSSSSTIYTPA